MLSWEQIIKAANDWKRHVDGLGLEDGLVAVIQPYHLPRGVVFGVYDKDGITNVRVLRGRDIVDGGGPWSAQWFASEADMMEIAEAYGDPLRLDPRARGDFPGVLLPPTYHEVAR